MKNNKLMHYSTEPRSKISDGSDGHGEIRTGLGSEPTNLEILKKSYNILGENQYMTSGGCPK